MADETRYARLRGVRVHNLKGIDLDLPLDRLVVLTGVSGSGKSSLAFDTLFAEGQRRYIETFSAYTRQFLQTLDKPDADRIDGLPPAIAVAQRVARRSGRTTVGTMTEVHDYLALLYARLGRIVCRNCGLDVRPADAEDVAKAIDALPEGTRYQVAFPLEVRPETDRTALADVLRGDGFVRVRADGQAIALEDGPVPMPADGAVEVIVDRLVRGREDPSRRLDSIETAFQKGLGRCRIVGEAETLTFYNGWRCARCGADYLAPEPRLFLYGSAVGACPTCEGFGRVIDLDLTRVVPDPAKSLADGAIAPWTTPAYRGSLDELLRLAPALGLPTDVPFASLGPAQVRRIVEGDPGRGFLGLRGFFRLLESKTYKVHVRVFLSRWRGYHPCPDCGGKRLRPEALAVRLVPRTGEESSVPVGCVQRTDSGEAEGVGALHAPYNDQAGIGPAVRAGLDIAALSSLTIREARAFLANFAADEGGGPIVRRALDPVLTRLEYLERIGLDYLELDRLARTLSGGEARRVSLTTALGSGLVNTLYVLDEPSIGLHPRDVGRLIAILRALRDAGNSVVVVEHEAEIMRAADLLIDIGPGAGEAGGRVLYVGPPAGVAGVAASATGAFLSGRLTIPAPERRRPPGRGSIVLRGAAGHNLQSIDVEFPLGLLCVVTGVSGSGKSTLVEETLYPALLRRIKNEHLPGAPYRELAGAEGLDDVVLIDQAPIGRSSRSNPVTYLKAFDEIRKTFAETHEAKLRHYGPSKFSFNVPGGRCDACEGTGDQTIDMQFLADVRIRCPECRGRRYRPEVLEVTYRGKNIAEVLDLTVRESFSFFRHRPKAQTKLRPLLDVGLDYLRLGQPASTLSGGEAQRLKLAGFLATSPAAATRQASSPKTLFLLDEPTTGLHPADTAKLLDALHALADLGHSLIVVEHSPEVMRAADWIIDLGPEAGAAGGRIVAQGTPEEVARSGTHTGRALAEVFGSSEGG
jgi:excinuclease ABC subunit A